MLPTTSFFNVFIAQDTRDIGLSLQALHNRLDWLAEKLGVEREDIVLPALNAGTRTPLGKCVQGLCTAVEQAVDAFHAQIEPLKRELPKSKSELRLAIVSSIWDTEQDWMKADFEKQMPGVQLLEQPSVALVVETAILAGKADVAINYTPKRLVLLGHKRTI